MILKAQSTILDIDAFISSLQRLRRGVFRVVMPNQKGICTGWLLTDQLVVVPSYAFGSDQPAKSGYICYQSTEKLEIAHEADLCYKPGEGFLATAPGLLRLHQPVKDTALSLQTKLIESGTKVMLLQFPNGQGPIAFSMGQIILIDDTSLKYEADTLPGSGGAPVLNLSWEVIGYHHSGSFEVNVNEGTSLSGLFQGLRASPVWSEIVAYHRIADVVSTEVPLSTGNPLSPNKSVLDSAMLRAAVQWSFDPATFSEDERAELETMVIDESSDRWILTPDERQRILRQAGSLSVLRQARGSKPTDDPRQAVIDRLLTEPRFDLTGVNERDLPYWLQAVRWFEGFIPNLPSAGEVSQTLERRRIRSQFEPIAGATFRGRVAELDWFERWFKQNKPGPLVVSGIGGVGKSSLVARFALTKLPADTLLLWLDFDRADIAPDDAPSVLALIGQQASLQLTNFDGPNLTELVQKSAQLLSETEKAMFNKQVQQATVAMGKALGRQITNTRTPLLVLDGFEVAQHRQQYNEIWGVLESLLKEAPSLRIIISGRSPVRDLKLAGRRAESKELTGISAKDADAWLFDQGITSADVRPQVIRIAKGIPLNLRLAVRLAKVGGDLSKLPQDLQENMVSGYLYDRILDRVIDVSLKPVVEAVLVLRKVTPTLLNDVLTDTLPVDIGAVSPGTAPAEETFNRLARELAVVDANAVSYGISAGTLQERTLWVRPDLRRATLHLLEIDKPKRVRELDQRAANWYATRNLTDEATVAELVYHRLRLGDIDGAKAAWNDTCVPYLIDAEDDLRPDAKRERDWLRSQLQQASTPANTLLVWEKDALERIQRAQGRGLDRILGSILSEQSERSVKSPLRFYDAWLRYQQGDLSGARSLLEQATEIDGPMGRDQAVLAAQLAVLTNDRPAADKLLAAISDPERWADRSQGSLEVLAVKAARIRLTVDLDEEFKLLTNTKLGNWKHEIQRYLSEYDVVLPPLRQGLNDPFENMYESASAPTDLSIPYTEQRLPECRTKLVRYRELASSWSEYITKLASSDTLLPTSDSDLSSARKVIRDFPEDVAESILKLALLSRQRIDRITDDMFLMNATKMAMQTDEALQLSITGTLGALHSWDFTLVPEDSGDYISAGSLNTLLDLVWDRYAQRKTSLSTRQGVAWAGRFIQMGEYGQEVTQWIQALSQQMQEAVASTKLDTYTPDQLFLSKAIWPTESHLPQVLLYMLSPDPLEALCRRLLSLPETFIFQAPLSSNDTSA